MGYIYLVQEREFVRLNENVYKIGKSKQKNCARIKSYPKQSKLICIFEVDNINEVETELKNIFKIRFKLRDDYGSEYFEGFSYLMVKEICDFIYKRYDLMDPNEDIKIVDEIKEDKDKDGGLNIRSDLEILLQCFIFTDNIDDKIDLCVFRSYLSNIEISLTIKPHYIQSIKRRCINYDEKAGIATGIKLKYPDILKL